MARDRFHYEFKEALEKEGWDITHDPLYLKIGQIPVHIDLGAERLIAAQKANEKIAIEIKTFGHSSFITALYEALGKYIVYRKVLKILQPYRTLYLGVPNDIYQRFQAEQLVKSIFEEINIKLVLYDSLDKKIIGWINY